MSVVICEPLVYNEYQKEKRIGAKKMSVYMAGINTLLGSNLLQRKMPQNMLNVFASTSLFTVNDLKRISI